MAFSDSDLASLADDFMAVPGGEILRPRATERMHGGNSGFAHFTRAVQVFEKPQPTARKCQRCRQPAATGRSCCALHLELKRREAIARLRRQGRQPWKPWFRGGRPPDVVRRAVNREVATQEMLLNDALIEQAAINRRVSQLRSALTLARKAARHGRRA
jgi:hypothetical protein